MHHSIKITRSLAIGVLAFSGLALGPAAHASTLVQTRTSDVSYSDLNLATRHGDRTLLNRIDHAAVKACGSYPSGPELDVYRRFDACHAKAMSNAVHAINNASVSQLYAQLHNEETSVRTG